MDWNTCEQRDKIQSNTPSDENESYDPESNPVRSNSPEYTDVKHQNGQFDESKAGVIQEIHNEKNETQLRMRCRDMNVVLTEAKIDPVYAQGTDSQNAWL